MNQKVKEKAIHLYERGILHNANCFYDFPEIVRYQLACKEFNKQQKILEEFLYSNETSTSS